MKLALALLLLTATSLQAQTKPVAPLEAPWSVAINGNFSSLQNETTNNGVLLSTAIRLATHWSIRADTYLFQTPNITVVLGGPEYRFSLAHIFKNSTGAINAQNVEAFINAGVGDARSTAIVATTPTTVTTTSSYLSKLAYSVGAGFDIRISDTVSMRPLDVKYIKSSMIAGGGQLVGNHISFGAGLGLRF
jgi:hypothetical protein